MLNVLMLQKNNRRFTVNVAKMFQWVSMSMSCKCNRSHDAMFKVDERKLSAQAMYNIYIYIYIYHFASQQSWRSPLLNTLCCFKHCNMYRMCPLGSLTSFYNQLQGPPEQFPGQNQIFFISFFSFFESLALVLLPQQMTTEDMQQFGAGNHL